MPNIKPGNILVDYEEMTGGNDLAIKSVQISDLEDAVLFPPGKNLKGCPCGNQLWRSPEFWARARRNTPSDIFPFGVVIIIYVMLDDMIFRVNISNFGDEDGFKGLLWYVGEDNRIFNRLVGITADFDAQRLRKPFSVWHYVSVELRDLVKMTNLDPSRRITARGALDHPWFRRADLR
ncbi:kinase-like domain-containing protein [Lasiosphaeria hispida]|uniref:Kinase-like domain-containing protein n=1 Tax=Lasiosphaeria hispida TaxID=260671 RepID=A0AAJ0MA17_9PEZI|nr:kinase-like domain-containing protein [Lasiosphaeria hispida]